MPPPSSKKRSATSVRSVGTTPRIFLPARTYATACSAPARSSAHFPLEPRDRVGVVALVDRYTHGADLARELDGAPAPFTVPERNGWRGAVRVLYADHAGFHAPDLPRVGAEKKDIAGHALDREVFVERADDVAVGSTMTL